MIYVVHFSVQHGKPNTDWKNDTVGQPVNPAVKMIQAISLRVAKMLRSHVDIDTGNEHLNAAGSVAAQVAEDQIAADPHATPQERLKMAGGTALEGVQENVDNDAVKIAAGVAKVRFLIGSSNHDVIECAHVIA